jgi:hypothetical protein
MDLLGAAIAPIIALWGIIWFMWDHNSTAPIYLLVAALVMLILSGAAFGRDLGQWDHSDPELRKWYESLTQPDVPSASCCGEADAYWCDDISVREPHVYCRITDDRDDAPLKRPHLPMGTEIEIPINKYKTDAGNPTGHAIIFLSVQSKFVYCFVQGAGG